MIFLVIWNLSSQRSRADPSCLRERSAKGGFGWWRMDDQSSHRAAVVAVERCRVWIWKSFQMPAPTESQSSLRVDIKWLGWGCRSYVPQRPHLVRMSHQRWPIGNAAVYGTANNHVSFHSALEVSLKIYLKTGSVLSLKDKWDKWQGCSSLLVSTQTQIPPLSDLE